MNEEYKELLSTEEWQQKRLEILKRDGYTCQECGKYGIMPDVHHKCYRTHLYPWEHDNSDLISLCKECHKKAHQSDIPVYDENGDYIKKLSRCDRCGGIGYIPIYKHVDGGICFKCWGDGCTGTERIFKS